MARRFNNLRRFPALANPKQFLSDLAYLSQRLETYERLFARVRALEWADESQDLKLAKLAIRPSPGSNAVQSGSDSEWSAITEILGEAARNVLSFDLPISLSNEVAQAAPAIVDISQSSFGTTTARYTATIDLLPSAVAPLADRASALILPFEIWKSLQANAIERMVQVSNDLEYLVIRFGGSTDGANGHDQAAQLQSDFPRVDEILVRLPMGHVRIERLTLLAQDSRSGRPALVIVKFDQSRTAPFSES